MNEKNTTEKKTHTQDSGLYDGYVCLEDARYVELLRSETKLNMLCKLIEESVNDFSGIDYEKVKMLNTLFNKDGAA